MKKTYHSEERQTALITGASGGLGLAFAREFASHGFDVVLTARSEDKLHTIAEELQAQYQIRATAIPSDLSTPDGARKLYDAVCAVGIRIDQLVNNAGAGKHGETVEMDVQVMTDLIYLNVISVTTLCRLFGADMKRRGYGKILNVASLGAFIPDPFFNVYGPTKAFELFLSEAMYGELKGSGVHVCAICPGPTKTNWAKNAGKADSRMALDPKKVARIGFEGLQKNKLIIIPTATFKAEKAALSLLPPKARVAFIRRWQQNLIRQKISLNVF